MTKKYAPHNFLKQSILLSGLDRTWKLKTYDGTFKATVVLEYIDGKSELTAIADKYQLHPIRLKTGNAGS
jgi:hypothetical protein